MEHLILRPIYGLCNRLRAIGSSLHACKHYQAKLSILSPEGDLRRLIELPNDVEILSKEPDLSDYFCIEHSNHNSLRDLSKSDRIFIKTGATFNDPNLPKFSPLIFTDYIKPSREVLAHADSIKKKYKLFGHYVGLHVRRGDHNASIKAAPFEKIRYHLVQVLEHDPEVQITLACEDKREAQLLCEIAPERIILITEKQCFWRGRFDLDAIIKDFAELIVLSKGEYVIGCKHSSYSRKAIAFNGDSRCFTIG